MQNKQTKYELFQDEAPLEMIVDEELEVGTEIGTLQAYDQDVDDNANIGYLITCKSNKYQIKRVNVVDV